MDSNNQTLVGYVSSLSEALTSMSTALDRAVRSGSDVDEPEGSRYVKFSDTLVTKWAEYFRGIASQLGGTDVKATTEQHVVRGSEEEQVKHGESGTGQESGSPDAVARGEPDLVP